MTRETLVITQVITDFFFRAAWVTELRCIHNALKLVYLMSETPQRNSDSMGPEEKLYTQVFPVR